MSANWHESRDNVNGLARLLIGFGIFETAAELQAYHDTPWRWTDAWDYWQQRGTIEGYEPESTVKSSPAA